ncbi:MAG: guanylate kinase [Flavobacteriales bacterium]
MNGKAIIFSAPSGAGKTTIVKYLLGCNLNLEFSVSACSRSSRGSEVNGKDYYFLSVEEFKNRIAKKDFLEWEEVYQDNYYGTLNSEIDRIWKNDHHVIFDVDVKGGLSLKKHFGKQALAIFVMPPSVNKLEERLRSRKTETEESIKRRLAKANDELKYAPQFDFTLVNDDLETACQEAFEKVRQFLQS